jgi:archaellum component FlaC
MKKFLILFFLVFQFSCSISDPEMMELLREIKAQNETLLEDVEEMRSQLEGLDGKYQVILASLADNKKELEDLKTQIDALKAQLTQQLDKINQLSTQLEVQGADVKKLSSEIAALKASCEELKGLIEELLSDKSPIPTNGLIAWYPFNGNANDESGNKWDGVVYGANLVPDRSNISLEAYFFDGLNDFIQTPFEGVLGNNERTISFWAKTNMNATPDGMAAVSYGPNGLGTRFDGFFNFNKLGATANIGGAALSYDTPKPVNDDEWHHYVFMIDVPNSLLENIKIYQDGIQLKDILSIYDSPKTQVNTKSGGNLVFGKTNYAGIPAYFKGSIDDVAIWNRALTSDEILKIYKGDKF